MPARHRWIRTLAAATGVVVLLWSATAPALADALDDAESAAARGDKAATRTALAAYFADSTVADPDDLLRAAQLARALPDIELLRSARARGEALEGTAEANPPALDLALGFAYLGLAEENLRLRTTSRSVSLYFADALTRAQAVPADHPQAETAARLAAGVRFAQGDLGGAVDGLTAFRAGRDEISARFDALHGRLLYERAAALPVSASGHPTDQARAWLMQAGDWLARAARADALTPVQRRAAALHQAYALHRLGQVDAAEAAYGDAFAADGRQATLVVRGLQSLHARDAARLLATLDALAGEHDDHTVVLDAILQHHRGTEDRGAAVLASQRRLAAAPADALGWYWAGKCLAEAGIPGRALDHFVRAIQLDPKGLSASWEIEQLARQALADDPARTIAIYERLLALRPDDPYARNNYGFILRDLVSAHTEKLAGGLERLPRDAPAGPRERLARCVAVYAEAVALLDPARDADLDAPTAWNVAGIINDYALIVHYFLDVQDGPLAERLYLRALAMTDYGFKDTYAPNMQRLYGHVLTGPEHVWRWYRVAREARYAILAEQADGQGGITLVADEAKRAAAEKDVTALRARILQVLKDDAREDGLPWPPTKENGNDR